MMPPAPPKPASARSLPSKLQSRSHKVFKSFSTYTFFKILLAARLIHKQAKRGLVRVCHALKCIVGAKKRFLNIWHGPKDELRTAAYLKVRWWFFPDTPRHFANFCWKRKLPLSVDCRRRSKDFLALQVRDKQAGLLPSLNRQTRIDSM